MNKSGYITLKLLTSSIERIITCAVAATMTVSILDNDGKGYSLLNESGAAGI